MGFNDVGDFFALGPQHINRSPNKKASDDEGTKITGRYARQRRRARDIRFDIDTRLRLYYYTVFGLVFVRLDDDARCMLYVAERVGVAAVK